jgi:hypothetical protein
MLRMRKPNFVSEELGNRLTRGVFRRDPWGKGWLFHRYAPSRSLPNVVHNLMQETMLPHLKVQLSDYINTTPDSKGRTSQIMS